MPEDSKIRNTAGILGAWRFLLLTSLICAYLLLTPWIAANLAVQVALEVLLLASVLVTVSANQGWRKLCYMLVMLWVVSVGGTLIPVFLSQPDFWKWYRTVELITSVPLLALVAFGILAFVRQQAILTVDSIFATVAAYLILSILFTQVYLLLITWNIDSFAFPPTHNGDEGGILQAEVAYFSLVTLATVGYGDLLPSTHLARMLAMFQAVVGQFYIAVVVALFVGMYSAKRVD
jgi:hypothetical protein